jgi:hypothetical protein
LAAAFFLGKLDSDKFVNLAKTKNVTGESFAEFYIGQKYLCNGERETARAHFSKAVNAAADDRSPSIVANWAAACLKLEQSKP